MAIRYIPYFPNTLEGQALLDNFVRTKRVLRYRDNNRAIERIERGMPFYEIELRERVGTNADRNLLVQGECLSACAYLKDRGITVDLVYIDPPFASGADYAKKVYLRRNPKVAEAVRRAESELEIDELKTFEEKMYGDIWNKESYLNWMYENLMAIRSVMSDTASIYVHLDWHIGHYVKILMDEVFGEDNFRNEIVWKKYGGVKNQASQRYTTQTDSIFWYSVGEEVTFNVQYRPMSQKYVDSEYKYVDEEGRRYALLRGRSYQGSGGQTKKKYLDENPGSPITSLWDDDNLQLNTSSAERVDYATQKPEALLERIIKAGSNEGMVVADFFGGSGVTAAVASRLGRKFIHVDINLNSIQVTRERLRNAGAGFDVMEVKDGVSLYRNPVQTMEKLRTLIPGLRNEEALDKFWAGAVIDTEYGMVPVYLPNLMDGSTRLLDKPLMNRILHEAMPDLPEDTRRVVIYYIDIDDRKDIERFIKEQNNTLIEVEFRDLKQVLDEVVVEDYAEWSMSVERNELFEGWKVEILQFQSDRVRRKIEEVNQKNRQQVLNLRAKGKNREYTPIELSEEGLETIEWVSLDCTTSEKCAPWHSECEIKVDKSGYVIKDGIKTGALWDASIRVPDKPLRMKIRNICGDETVYVL